MNVAFFIASRIISGKNRQGKISRPIVFVAIAGIAIGISVMIITLAIVEGFQREIRNKIIGFDSHITVTSLDLNTSQELNPIELNSLPVKEIRGLPGVKHVQSFATKIGLVKTKNEIEGALLKGIDKDFDWGFIRSKLIQGTTFSVNDTTGARKVVIPQLLSDRLGLKLNDKLAVYFLTSHKDTIGGRESIEYEKRVRTFTICGIYETGIDEFDRKKMLLIDMAQIRKLNYWTDQQVGGLEIQLSNYQDIDKLGEEIDQLVGVQYKTQTVKQNFSAIFSWLDLLDMNAVIIICLMLVVSGINMISALLILILERTGMIGLIKAMGGKNSMIRQIFMYNGAYLIGMGLLFGNVLGLGLCYIQQQFGVFTLSKESYYLSVVPVHLNFLYILLLNVGTLIACLIMLLLPSLIVSRITPVKAIRFS